MAAALVFTVARVDLDAWTTARQYSCQIVARANSPYGRLVVANDSGQLTFYENGSPTFSTDQAERVEETVHFALSQRPDARRVGVRQGHASPTHRSALGPRPKRSPGALRRPGPRQREMPGVTLLFRG